MNDFDAFRKDAADAPHSLLIEATGFGKGLLVFVSMLAAVGLSYLFFLLVDHL